MNNENNISFTDELMARYLAGEATPEESMALLDGLQNADNRRWFEAVAATWYATHPAKRPRTPDVHAAWRHVTSRTHPMYAQNTRPADHRHKRTWRVAVAAALALLVAAAVAWYGAGTAERREQLTAQTADSTLAITFSDGTRAIMARHSVVQYPVKFTGRERRIVFLQGEAFMMVSPDKEHPFIIDTPHGAVMVVGTSFHLALRTDSLVVGVAEGSVVVHTAADSVAIAAGTAATFGRAHHIGLQPVDPNAWAFATYKFSFRDTPLREVAASLEKAYGCRIRLAHPALAQCRVTASFDHLPVQHMLGLIAETLNASVSQDKTTFVLEGEGCP